MYVGFYQASQAQLDLQTPRMVYRWFLFVYRLCYSCAVSGCAPFPPSAQPRFLLHNLPSEIESPTKLEGLPR